MVRVSSSYVDSSEDRFKIQVQALNNQIQMKKGRHAGIWLIQTFEKAKPITVKQYITTKEIIKNIIQNETADTIRKFENTTLKVQEWVDQQQGVMPRLDPQKLKFLADSSYEIQIGRTLPQRISRFIGLKFLAIKNFVCCRLGTKSKGKVNLQSPSTSSSSNPPVSIQERHPPKNQQPVADKISLSKPKETITSPLIKPTETSEQLLSSPIISMPLISSPDAPAPNVNLPLTLEAPIPKPEFPSQKVFIPNLQKFSKNNRDKLCPLNFQELLSGDIKKFVDFDKLNEICSEELTPENGYSKVIAQENLVANKYQGNQITHPWDHNCVLLQVNNEKLYCNASEMHFNGTTYYAAEAPTENNCSRMLTAVEQKKVETIVALAMPIEAGRDKCYNYWDRIKAAPFALHDGSTIQFVNEKTIALGEDLQRIVERTFEITSEKSEKPKTVTQLHYENWPDMGIPDPRLFDVLVDQVKSNQVWVHCSGGIGRTPTFIAAHSLRHEIDKQIVEGKSKEEIYINIEARVMELRTARDNSIQTPDQLEAVYAHLKRYTASKFAT